MGLLVVVVTLMVVIAAPVHAGGGPVVEGIEVIGDDAPAVRLHVSAPVVPQARTLPTDGAAPRRIYVDLTGVTLAPGIAHIIPGAGPLLRVRIGQFDAGTARVVLDLERAMPFTIHQTDGTVTLELAPPPVAPLANATRAPAPTPAPIPTPAP